MTAEALAAPPAPARSVVSRLVGGAAVDSAGTGIAAAGAILYFVTMRGFPAGSVALAMSTGAILGVGSPILSGRLADRYGVNRVYVVLLLLRGLFFLAYPLAATFPAFLVLTWVILALESTTPPLQQALVGRLFGARSRVRVMALVRAVRNAAIGAGTLAVGLALATGKPWLVGGLLALNGASFVVLAVVVFSLRRQPEQEPAAPSSRAGRPPPAFLGLTAVNGLLLLHDSVLFVLLPLWLVTRMHASPVLVSALLVLNTILSVVLQMVLARRRAGGLTAAVAFLIAACLCGAVVENLAHPALVAAGAVVVVVLLTAGENLHTVVAWEVSYAAAPPGRSGEYLSVFATGYAVQRVAGPVTMTAVVLGLGTGGWIVLAAVFVAAAAVFATLAKAVTP